MGKRRCQAAQSGHPGFVPQRFSGHLLRAGGISGATDRLRQAPASIQRVWDMQRSVSTLSGGCGGIAKGFSEKGRQEPNLEGE